MSHSARYTISCVKLFADTCYICLSLPFCADVIYGSPLTKNTVFERMLGLEAAAAAARSLVLLDNVGAAAAAASKPLKHGVLG